MNWDIPEAPVPVKKVYRERTIEKRGKRWAKQNGWLCIKVGFDDWPDDLFIKNGVHVWWEFKRPGEVPTEAQYARIDELRDAGCNAGWSDNAEQLVDVLKRWP